MPPYSGAHFQVLLRAPLTDASVEPITVTAREWESCITNHVPGYPDYQILGRIRNLDVELFGVYPSLEEELLSLDYTVRPYDRSICMSIYADTEVKDRTLLQKLQDQLYEVLRDHGHDIGYGLVAETPSDWVLVAELDRGRYNPQNPCPPILTAADAEYNTIGYILDNDVFLTAAEKTVKRFYFGRPPWVKYRILDKTIATEYDRYLDEEKRGKRSEHQRKKRKAKKVAAQKAKGTELERQGALEAGGKDKRKGGKRYKKPEDVDVDENAGAGAAEEQEEQAEIGLEKLAIGQIKPQIAQKIANGNSKTIVKEEAMKKKQVREKEEVKKQGVWDTPWKKDSAVNEIRKPGWFFSGEDVLKGSQIG